MSKIYARYTFEILVATIIKDKYYLARSVASCIVHLYIQAIYKTKKEREKEYKILRT